MDRGNSIMQTNADVFVAATEVGAGRYSERFLAGINAALHFKPIERPQTITAWRAMFGGEVPSEAPTTIAPVTTEQPKPIAESTNSDETPRVETQVDPTRPEPRRGGTWTAALLSLLIVGIGGAAWWWQKQEVLAIMRDYDSEGSGQIEFPDFLEIMTTKISERDPVEEILKAFKLFDEDSTGLITVRNLRRVARELGENLSDDELQAMIDEFDKDGDGQISEQEFLNIMKQTSIY